MSSFLCIIKSKAAAAGSEQQEAGEIIYCSYFIFGNAIVNKFISKDIPWTQNIC